MRSPNRSCVRRRGGVALADESLFDLDVAGLLQRAHLLREHRVCHFDTVPNKAKLGLLGGGEHRDHGKAHRMTQKVVQLMPRMAQSRLRLSSQTPMTRGITPNVSLIPKW